MIAIELINRQRKCTFTKDMAEAMTTVAETLCRLLPYETDSEANITLVSDGPIRTLNREERGVDAATDVLSFPTLEWEPGREGQITLAQPWDYNPETGRIMLGDIVISLEHAYAQAEEYGHSPLREVAFLCAHGLLHLLGYDHVEEEEPMFSLQRRILDEAKLTRDV